MDRANRAFVDTSYFLALNFTRDQYYGVATQHWRRSAAASRQLVTTSFVLAEVVTFLSSRGYHALAVEVGGNLLNSGPLMQFIHVDEDLLLEGWAYFQQHSDKQYSLTDCVSFVLMRRLNISTALIFDHHFAQAGFATAP